MSPFQILQFRPKVWLGFLLVIALATGAYFYFYPPHGPPVVWSCKRADGREGYPELYLWFYRFGRSLSSTFHLDTDLASRLFSPLKPTQDMELIVALDKNGRECFSPVFSKGHTFTPGHKNAIVFTERGIGLLSPTGKWLLPPIYKHMSLCEERWIETSLHGEEYFDTNGKKLDIEKAAKEYFEAGPEPTDHDSAFYQVAIVGDKKGNFLTDLSGKVLFHDPGVIIREFRNPKDLLFGQGLILVIAGDKWGLIRSDGTWFLQPKFDILGVYREGLIPAGICSEEDRDEFPDQFGFIDSNGVWVIPPIFKEAYQFSEGLAPALDPKTKLWGYINHKGEWEISPRFDTDFWDNSVYGFKKGFCRLSLDSGWGLIDRKGNWVVPPEFEELQWINRSQDPYHVGIFQKGYKSGMIDKSGKIIAEAVYDSLDEIKDDHEPNPDTLSK